MALQADEQKIPRSIATYAPEYFTIRLKYFGSLPISTNATGTLKTQAFKLNNIYRPDGSAHDVNGYDLWAGIYKYNRVIGAVCKMTWTYFDTNADAAIIRCGYEVLGSTGDAATTYDKGMEKQHFSYVGDVSAGVQIRNTTSNGSVGNIPYKLSAEYVYNPSKIADNIEDMSENSTFVAFGAAADTPHTLNMWAVDMNSSQARIMKFECQMIYTVQLRELRYDNGMLVQDTT